MLDKLKQIVQILDRLKKERLLIDYCLIGGLAVAARGYPRATAAIDFAIRIDDQNAQSLCDKTNFNLRKGDAFDPLKAVFYSSHEDENIQLIQFWPKLEQEVFTNVATIEFDGQGLRVIGLVELLLLKFLAGSKKDLLDVEELIAANDLSNAELTRLEALKSHFIIKQD